MTQEQFLRAMTNIDDTFILEAMPKLEPKPKRGAGEWIRYAVAACLCLLVIGSILWQVVKPVPAKAFEIEDGVLLAYHGTDAEVVIPDEVTKISASAFAAAPSPEGITSLHIGENVAEIEEDALAPLTLLDTVTVAEENEFFEVVDGVLARKDGTLLFASIGAGREYLRDSVLVDVMRRVKNGELPFATVSKILVGNATVEVEMKEDPYGPLYYVSAVTVYGKTTVLPDEAFPINGYQKLQMFELKECFVISFLGGGVGQTYIMTEEETFIINNPSSDIIHEGMKEPSLSVIRLYTDGENLLYERTAEKFYQIQPPLELVVCVSREEFYCETGTVSLNEGKLAYHPMEVKRICDVREDLDAYWAKYAERLYWTDPNEVSLDEFFEKNAEKYDRAY